MFVVFNAKDFLVGDLRNKHVFRLFSQRFHSNIFTVYMAIMAFNSIYDSSREFPTFGTVKLRTTRKN